MKSVILATSMAMVSFSIQAQSLSEASCDILQSQIKDTLKYQSLSIRDTQREILRTMTPNIDLIKLEDLKQRVADRSYDGSYISYAEESELDVLLKAENVDSFVPTDKELEKHTELLYKNDASPKDLKELRVLAKKIHSHSINNFKAMTSEQKIRLSVLKTKMKEHSKRKKIAAQAKLELNNFVRGELKKIVVQNPNRKEVFNYKEELDSTQIEGELSHISVEEYDLTNRSDRPQLSSIGSGIYSVNPVQLDIKNLKGDSNSKRSYRLNAFGSSLSLKTSEAYVLQDNEINRSLNEIVLSEDKTWSDFNKPYLDKSYRYSSKITGIGVDIKSTLNLVTSEVEVGYRTQVENKEGQWVTFPSEYTTLDELSELLLPKTCKALDKAEVAEKINEDQRSDVVKEKSFLGRIFSKKKSRVHQK